MDKYHLSYNSIFKQHWGFHEPPSLFDLGIRKQIEQAVNEENYELAEKIARDCIRECSDVVYEDVSILLCDALFNQKKMQEYDELKKELKNVRVCIYPSMSTFLLIT